MWASPPLERIFRRTRDAGDAGEAFGVDEAGVALGGEQCPIGMTRTNRLEPNHWNCTLLRHRSEWIFLEKKSTRRWLLLESSAVVCSCYWLIATPLKEATPIALEVATGVRSPWPSMAKTAT